MKVAVWGAGNIGTGLVRRLATCRFVSEVIWINRSLEAIRKPAVDIEQGLSFAPCCRDIRTIAQENVGRELADTDLLIPTLGSRVPRGGGREDIYRPNADIFRQSLIPAVKGFGGIVVVVTNPVDLMTRLIYQEANLNWRRIVGLGTVVETARIRAAIGGFLSPPRPARDVWAYAVGTHDQSFVPILMPHVAAGAALPEIERQHLLRMAKSAATKGAERVKTETGSSLHPIVEGVVAVAEAVCTDSRAVLTVSCWDPATEGDGELFYSMPCAVGRNGVEERFSLNDQVVFKQLQENLQQLREQIDRQAGGGEPM